ncbi:hypothetical protein NL676_008271 [Syzygium grande]|nr:hypothetical protein NL676_008271 [Syzygium grande]
MGLFRCWTETVGVAGVTGKPRVRWCSGARAAQITTSRCRQCWTAFNKRVTRSLRTLRSSVALATTSVEAEAPGSNWDYEGPCQDGVEQHKEAVKSVAIVLEEPPAREGAANSDKKAWMQ